MPRASIDLTGPGTFALVPAVAGRRIITARMVLTFSHAETQAQKVTFLSGSTIVAGPFYVLDGGEIEYTRRAGEAGLLTRGDAFNIGLEACDVAGVIEYDLGAE